MQKVGESFSVRCFALTTDLRAVKVISLAGELLGSAEGLLNDGLHPSEVAAGYSKAGAKVKLRPCLTKFQYQLPASCKDLADPVYLAGS